MVYPYVYLLLGSQNCEALVFAYIRGALLDTYSSTILRKNRFVMDHYGCTSQSLNCVQ